MLPHETHRHARTIFAKFMVARQVIEDAKTVDADAFAQAAVRMARQFATVVDHHQAGSALLKAPSGVQRMPTFEELACDWHRHITNSWASSLRRHVLLGFRKHLFPSIGTKPVNEVTPADIFRIVGALQDAGHIERAHQLCRQVTRVYGFGIASGLPVVDPGATARAGLRRWQARHRPTILLPRRVGELLRAIDEYRNDGPPKYLLRLLPLVFVRPSELRAAEWAEFDLKRREWRIPAQRMKCRRPHIVPLSRQALKLLRELHEITGRYRYVFASTLSKTGIMSRMPCADMLKNLGFAGEMSMSGFRSLAATLLSELGWNPDAIEKQLSHLDARQMRRTYNFAEYLPERRRMMQAWADYLDRLRRESKARERSCRLRTTEKEPFRKRIYAIQRGRRSRNAWFWHVEFKRRGKKCGRYFFDFKLGGPEKSLAAAKAWRNKQLRKIPPLTLRERHELRSASNASGVAGVWLAHPKKQPLGVWKAQLHMYGGRRRLRQEFSIRKFGAAGAFKRAVGARRAFLKQVPNKAYVRDTTAARLFLRGRS